MINQRVAELQGIYYTRRCSVRLLYIYHISLQGLYKDSSYTFLFITYNLVPHC